MFAHRMGQATESRQGSAPTRAGRGLRRAVVAYCLLLAAFTVFVLLDTFALQRVESSALAADTTSIQAAQAQIASNAAQSSAAASDGEGPNAEASAVAQTSASTSGGVTYSSHGQGRETSSDSATDAVQQQAGSDAGSADSGDSASDDSASGDSASANSVTADSASADPASADSASVGFASAATGSASFTTVEGEVVYADENMQVALQTVRAYDTDVYIADVQVSSAEYLKAAFAQDAYGRNIKESTSDMAARTGSVLAINGDYYGFRDDGYVIRNGVLYRDTPAAGTDALVVYGDGAMAAVSQDEVSAQQLLGDGAWQVFSFGPVLVQDGQIAVGEGQEVGQAMTSNPRTAIGMVSPLHYIVVVSDGRTDASEGLSLYQLAQVMSDAGATFAYNLDGGGSTTMCIDGQIVNNPTGGRGSSERKVSDIVYFG